MPKQETLEPIDSVSGPKHGGSSPARRQQRPLSGYGSRPEVDLASNSDPAHSVTSSHSADDLMEAISSRVIGEKYLIRLTNGADLECLKHLTLLVNTSRDSLLELGDVVPNLESLVLDGSIIESVRDLGTNLTRLLSLSMNNCGLTDLDGIGVLSGLKQLSVCDNEISECSTLTMHDSIEDLVLSGNRIMDFDVSSALSSCARLRSLHLSRNPIEKAPKYRIVIGSLLPQLKSLDGVPLATDGTARDATDGQILEASTYMRLQEEELDDEMRMEMLMLDMNDPDFGGTGGASAGHGSPLRCGRGAGKTDMSAAGAISASSTTGISNSGNSGAAPMAMVSSSSSSASSSTCPTSSVPSPGRVPNSQWESSGSELTHGSTVVLAGNMAAAIRKRRAAKGGTDSSQEGPLRSTQPGEIGALLAMQENVRDFCMDSDSDHDDAVGRVAHLEGDVTALMTRGTAATHTQGQAGAAVGQLNHNHNPSSSSTRAGINTAVADSPAHARQATTTWVPDGAGDASNARNLFSTVDKRCAFNVPISTCTNAHGSNSRTSTSDSPQQQQQHSPEAVRATLGIFDDDGSDGSDVGSDEEHLVRAIHVPARGYGRRHVRESASDSSGGSPGDSEEEMWARSRHKQRPNSARGRRPGSASFTAQHSPSPSPQKTMHLHKKSIVHKDVVMRSLVRDDEDIAVDHASRHALAQRGGISYDDDNNNNDDDNDADCANVSGMSPAHKDHSKDLGKGKGNSNKRSVSAVSSRALGFDLLQSLAAIDQWVDDEDEKEGEGDEEDRGQGQGRGRSKEFDKAESVRGACDHDGSDGHGDGDGDTDGTILDRMSIKFNGNGNISGNSSDNGPAVGMDDAQLIEMLKRPPKSTPVLRTKSGFQQFFRGIHPKRMHALLDKAYAHMPKPEREQKILKRVSLLGKEQ